MTISEISRLTGLSTCTLRFYEKEFPKSLSVGRTSGGHRVYGKVHLRALSEIVRLVREEKLSLREAKIRLGEISDPEVRESSPNRNSAEEPVVSRKLNQVLDKLEELATRNQRMDHLLEELLGERSQSKRDELLSQIMKCRDETREAIRLYDSYLSRVPKGPPSPIPEFPRGGDAVPSSPGSTPGVVSGKDC